MKKIVMLLDRDQFVVSYDPKKATPEKLIAAIKGAGYTSQIVTDKRSFDATETTPASLPSGFPLLDDALTRARNERKLIVLDFSAEWCAPCQRMERTTFTDARVRELLSRCVFVKIDTDQQPELAERLGVVGLPDIRFVSPEGKVIHRLRGYQDAESFADELERFIQTNRR
ncbi:MAG: thioredoxin fold domain-containing protein [Blastocatellales bacterium]|nr:thioredoxin fold domain-containing protein [Blastocatellales bacterium]